MLHRSACVQFVYMMVSYGSMSIPVTARLDQTTVEAIDRAVTAGIVPNRGAAVARAVSEWLERHGEDAIVHSYQLRYRGQGPKQDDLLEQIASFGITSCLANIER